MFVMCKTSSPTNFLFKQNIPPAAGREEERVIYNQINIFLFRIAPDYWKRFSNRIDAATVQLFPFKCISKRKGLPQTKCPFPFLRTFARQRDARNPNQIRSSFDNQIKSATQPTKSSDKSQNERIKIRQIKSKVIYTEKKKNLERLTFAETPFSLSAH